MKSFELQSPTEFIKDFEKEAKRAKKRIWIQTMFFETCKRTKVFEEVLIKGAKKGLDIQVVIDWSTKRSIGTKIHFYPLFPIRRQKRQKLKLFSKESKAMFKRLEQSGAKVLFANQPGVNGSIIPFLRRNHSKIFVIDDLVWTGGINLNDKAFDNIDFMIKFKNSKILKAIEKQFPQVYIKKAQNYLIDLDDNYRLLYDNGKYNKSIIYSYAQEMVKRAKKEIVFVSQYVPDGSLLDKIIEKANERVNVTIITSHKEHKVFTKFPYKPLYRRLKARIKYNPYVKIVHCSKKVHAKLLMVDKKEVIFGSHNFFKPIVLVGTQEISIHSKDKMLIKTLNNFIKRIPKIN